MTVTDRAAAVWRAARRMLARAGRYHEAVFLGRWRGDLAKEVRRREDLMVAMVHLQAMGIEDPASAFGLELYPEMVGAFHRWHQHQGIDRFPDAGVCC